jgi:hypothetical protein
MNLIRLNRILSFVIPGLACAVAGPQCAQAADWHFDPRATLSANYDDNYGLDSGASQNVSVFGGILDAGVKIHFADPLTQFEITPRVRSSVYPGHAEDQSNDQFVTSRFEHDWRTAQFTVDGFYWRQDVLRSYLPGTDIGTPLGQNTGGADIGAINEKIRQDFLFLSPAAMFDLSARERIELRTQFVDVGYSKQILNEKEDFKNYAGSLGFQYSLTQRSNITIRGTAAQLKPDGGSDAHTYGLEGEWDTHPSEVLQAYARLGVDRTTFGINSTTPAPATNNQSSATSVAGGLGLSRKFLVNQLFVDLARSVTPSSAGAIVARDELRLRLEHEFNARMSSYIGLRGIKEQALGDATGFVAQRYAKAAVGFEWRMLRDFSIVPEYAYTTLKDANLGSTAGSNSIMISLVYERNRPVTETGVRIGQ